MSLFVFTFTMFFSFYMIYKAIKTLDIIYILNNKGIKKQAKVIKIREQNDSNIDDFSSTTYYFTVLFFNKKGIEIEKEIEFGVDKKPKKMFLLTLTLFIVKI